MRIDRVLVNGVVIVSIAVVGCGEKTNSIEPVNQQTPDVVPTQTKLPDVHDQEPKDSIAFQLELLKAGNVDKLKACFTERLRDGITRDAVEQGRQEASSYSLDELVASVEMGEYQGKQTAKLMMKNGRTLTTLVKTDGKWLSDTIWFR